MKYERLVSFLLRTGLASVFLYAAVASFLSPDAWVGFLPSWARALVPANVLLFTFSAYELALAFWLMSAKKSYYAALLSSATLLAIIVQNIGALDLVFRDVAIFFSAVALAVMSREKK